MRSTISSEVPASFSLIWHPDSFSKSDFHGSATYPGQATRFNDPSPAPTDFCASPLSLLSLEPPQPAITSMVAPSPPTIAVGSQAERALKNLLTFLPSLPLRRRSDPLAIQFSLCGRVRPGPPRRTSPGSGGRFGALPLLRGRRDIA